MIINKYYINSKLILWTMILLVMLWVFISFLYNKVHIKEYFNISNVKNKDVPKELTNKLEKKDITELSKNIYINTKNNNIYNTKTQKDRNKLKKNNPDIYHKYMGYLTDMNLNINEVSIFVDNNVK